MTELIKKMTKLTKMTELMKKVTELIKRNDKNCKMNNNLLGPQSVMLAVKKLLLPIDINWFFLAKSVDSKD